MLARFVPWGAREPTFRVEPRAPGPPLTGTALGLRGLAGGWGRALAWSTLAVLEAAQAWRAGRPGFDPGPRPRAWGNRPAWGPRLALGAACLRRALCALGTAALAGGTAGGSPGAAGGPCS